MKKIIIVFLFSLIIPIHFTFALFIPSSLDIGGSNNPLYFQEIKDPYEIQRNANTQKENNLKSTYGLSNYYTCYSTYSSSCGITVDMGNPYNQASCLNFIQYCLERKAMKLGGSNQPSQISPVKTNDQICQGGFGINSNWDGTKDSSGRLNCGCQTGYAWSEQAKSCIVASIVPVQTNSSTLPSGCISSSGYSVTSGVPCDGTKPTKANDQICADKWANSYFTGTLNNKGGLTCDCKTSYQWNQDRTQCVTIPKTEIKIIAPVVKKSGKKTTGYTVKTGDTLYVLYGDNWRILSGYDGDPTQLKVGAIINSLPN